MRAAVKSTRRSITARTNPCIPPGPLLSTSRSESSASQDARIAEPVKRLDPGCCTQPILFLTGIPKMQAASRKPSIVCPFRLLQIPVTSTFVPRRSLVVLIVGMLSGDACRFGLGASKYAYSMSSPYHVYNTALQELVSSTLLTCLIWDGNA